MYQVARWLCKNGHVVRKHLEAKQVPWAPNHVWWVFLFAVRELSREANAVFVSLQGMSTLVRQQRDRFSGLVTRLCGISGTRGPLDDAEIASARANQHEVSGCLALSHEAAVMYMEGSDMWVCEVFSAMVTKDKEVVTSAVAKLFVFAVSSIHALTLSDETSPPVTPCDLIGTTMPEFLALTRLYRERLGSTAVYDLGQEFKSLKRQYADDETSRVSIDTFDHRLASFDAMWGLGDANVKYPALVAFCGGLATVFPNTATVEADFSVIGCEKTTKRTSLTDLSLEGMLHCKQWERLWSLCDVETKLAKQMTVSV